MPNLVFNADRSAVTIEIEDSTEKIINLFYENPEGFITWLDETRKGYPVESIVDLDADGSDDVIHKFILSYISSGTAFKLSSSGKLTKTRPDENGPALREIFTRLTGNAQKRYTSLGLNYKASPFNKPKFLKNSLLPEIRSIRRNRSRKARKTRKTKRAF